MTTNRPNRLRHRGCTRALTLIAILGSSGAALAAEYPALGPLPEKKAPKASLVEMGKRLFFDARMSGEAGKPQALSDAYPGTKHFRNAPTLINTRYKADFSDVGWAWDGHMGANLNDVVRNEITETMILNLDMRLMHERMKQDPIYVNMCKDNFNGECSSGKGRKALVAFVETLVSKDAPFDSGTILRLGHHVGGGQARSGALPGQGQMHAMPQRRLPVRRYAP